MGTLLKYEFRRSRTIFLGIIGVTLLIELLYLIGWCFEINILLAIGLIGGFLCIAFGAMAILLYGVIMFNDDISKKPGYLLFSTPRSAAQIVGSKLLMTLFALLGITILFSLLISLDVFLALQRRGTSIVAVLSMFDASITENGLKSVVFNAYNFLGMAMYLLSTVITAYVVIVLLKTIMGNQKGRTILGVILWFAIINAFSIAGGFLTSKLVPAFNNAAGEVVLTQDSGLTGTVFIGDLLHTVFSPAIYLPAMLLCVAGSVAGYLLTVWMMNRKLSV